MENFKKELTNFKEILGEFLVLFYVKFRKILEYNWRIIFKKSEILWNIYLNTS